MPRLECYVKELDRQRDRLANILLGFGVDASEAETYNSLIDKVAALPIGGGGGSGMSANDIAISNGGVMNDIFAIATQEGV